MEVGILVSIKNLLGVEKDYTPFDEQIIAHINSAFMVLHQLGVGSGEPFSIEGYSEDWKDFTGTDADFHAVKTFVYLKVREIWDPPSVTSVATAMERQIREYEWRLLVQADRSRT